MSTGLPSGLNWLINHSWQAGVLVLLVLLLQWVFRRHLTNRWRFALWWIVLLRLVLPFGPASAVSLFNVVRPAVRGPLSAKLAPVVVTPPAQNDFSKLSPQVDATPAQAEIISPDEFQPTPAISALPSVANPAPAISWTRWLIPGLVGLWLAGVLVLVCVVGIQCLRFYRKLARAATPAGAPLQDLLEECRGEFQMTRPIELLETEAVQSPALFGLFRPRLLLPRGIGNQFGRAELRYIFLHELAHVKRGDLWLNWLVTVLQILHWFNPLLWLGFARLRADRELACDELALLRAGDQAGTAYGETVVKLLEQLSRPTAIPGLVGILEDRQQIRRRIAMIADFRRPGRWSVLAVLLVVALAAAALTDAQTDKATMRVPVSNTDVATTEDTTNPKVSQSPYDPYYERENFFLLNPPVLLPPTSAPFFNSQVKGVVLNPDGTAVANAQLDKPPAIFSSVEEMPNGIPEGTLYSEDLHSDLMAVNSLPWVGHTVMDVEHSNNLQTGVAWGEAVTPGGRRGRTVIGRLQVLVMYPNEPAITNFSTFSLHLSSTSLNGQALQAELRPDGSFSVQDVPVGQYVLELVKPEHWGPTNWVKIYHSHETLSVPPFNGVPQNPVVDWGTVEMQYPIIPIPGAEAKGIVLTPADTPAAGTEVVLQLQFVAKSMGLSKEGFEPTDLREDGLLVNAGLDGSFTFPVYAGAKSVIARNDQGFAQVSLEQLKRSPQITLQPWGRIAGTFQLGHHPGTNELMQLSVRRGWSDTNGNPHELESADTLYESLQTTTDDQGRFVFTLVPPGLQTLCWLATTEQHGWNTRPLAYVEVQPGATVVTNVGSEGRTIMGRVKFSGGQPRDWISGTFDLMAPSWESRERRERLKTDTERRAYDQLPEVQAGKNYPRDYVIAVQPDGSFRSDEVDPGQYGVMCNVHTRQTDSPYLASVNYFTSQEVVIPAAKGENDDWVADLGVVEVARLKITKPTPAIKVAVPSQSSTRTSGTQAADTALGNATSSSPPKLVVGDEIGSSTR